MSATLKTNVCHLPRYIPGSTPEKCNGSADGYNVSMACENVWTLDIQCLYIHKTVQTKTCRVSSSLPWQFSAVFPQASGFQMRIVAKLYSRFFTRSEVSSCHAMTIRQNSIPYAVFNFKINHSLWDLCMSPYKTEIEIAATEPSQMKISCSFLNFGGQKAQKK